MKCPFCRTPDTKVIDSRLLDEDNTTKRRRKCERCLKRFTTFEKVHIAMPLVVKGDGRREDFNPVKIYKGISLACQKRPIATEQIEKIVENIEKTIMEMDVKEVSTEFIGNLVMGFLRVLDTVSYVRFASVYRKFQDIDEFVSDLRSEDEIKQEENPEVDLHE